MSEALNKKTKNKKKGAVFQLIGHLITDAAETLQSGGGEHVERAQFSSSGGAIRGCARGSDRGALHGPEAW